MTARYSQATKALAATQMAIGFMLFLLGLWHALDLHEPVSLRYLRFPCFTLAILQIWLASTLFRQPEWSWLPHTLLVLAWPLALVMLSTSEKPEVPRPMGPGGAGLGFVPAYLVLTVLGILAVGVLNYFLLVATRLVAMFQSRRQPMSQSPANQFSLATLLLASGLLPAAMGVDWYIPIQRLREAESACRAHDALSE